MLLKTSMIDTKAVRMSVLDDAARVEALAVLSTFRTEFYRCLTARADALFEVTDALLCTDGPVRSLVDLVLAPEHRRGHGGMYDGLNCGRVDVARLRRSVAGLPVPRAADGRIVLAVDVSPWLRSDAQTSPDRLFCHVYGRAKSQSQLIPGWPYSFVAALETGRTSWTAILDAVRLGPADDTAAVTADQLRAVVQRLITAGHHRPGDPRILIVCDAGYDIPRLAFLLTDLPVDLLGRLRSDRVMALPPPPRLPGTTGRPPKHGPELALADPAHLAGAADRHHDADRPLRHRHRDRLGPGPPTADPPHLLARPRRRPADHRRHPDPAAGRPPARRPPPETGLAVDLHHRGHRRGRGPQLAVLPAQIRPRTHLPAAQTDAGLDPTQDPHTRRGRPVDLADHRLPHPAPPRPRTSPRTSAGPGNDPPTRTGSPRPGSAADFATSTRRPPIPPVHRNPARPDPDGPQDRRTGNPRPATTSARP